MRNSDKIFLIPIIVLAANFLYRLWDASKLLFTFPLDTTNDISAYIALVHFFDKYGFLGFVPDWYNGFTLFNTYAPGWVFFTHPIYLLTNNLLTATYVSMILLFVLGFIGIWFLGREMKISKVKRVAFFLFVFANPMLIGAILKQGRLPSLMSLVIFVYIVYIAYYFKEKPVTKGILFLSLAYAAVILTHQAETILSGIFLIGLLFIKENQGRLKIITALVIGVALSAFWLIPFLKATMTTQFLDIGFSNWLLDFHAYFWSNLAGIIISLSLFVAFFIYYQQQKDTKTLLFFSPVLVLNLLFLLRLVLYIPIIKYIYPDPYQDFFTFFLSFFLVSIDYKRLIPNWRKAIAATLIFFSVAGVAYNMTQTPYFQEHTQTEVELLALIDDIQGKFIMINENTNGTSYSRAYYAYAAIYENKSSISGWGDMYKEFSYTDALNKVYREYLKTEDCNTLSRLHTEFNATEVLANGHYCETMIDDCQLTVKATEGNACLLEFTDVQQ